MGDPYRSSNYAPSQTYQPSQYAPPVPDTYASGALTTRHGSRDDGYYPSQSNMQLSQSSYRPSASDRRGSDYLDPNDGRSSRHHHKSSRSHSRHGSDEKSGGRERSKSRGKEWGATAAGAAAGGLIGNELGHGPLAALVGVAAGAYGAHELERKHERTLASYILIPYQSRYTNMITGHQEKKRLSRGEDPDRPRSSHHRRRSSGGLLGGLKDKAESLLSPDKDKDSRRSRSSVGGSRRSAKYDDSDYSDDDRYTRKSSGGGRSRGGDYY